MDVNLALVSGRLALPADFERLADGSQRARLLVHVRSERRGRFDVLPVVVPPDVGSTALASASGGGRVFVAGPLMRHHSPEPWQAPGRVEIVATSLFFPDLDGASTEVGSAAASGVARNAMRRFGMRLDVERDGPSR